MALYYQTGNLLDSSCLVLVNAVNCEGVAGAGLAKQFKERWPRQVAEYAAFCRAGKMQPGVLHEALLPDGRSIVSVPTKRHWREPSRFEDVQLGIEALAEYCQEAGNPAIALPALGCGLGGLPRTRVLREIEVRLGRLSSSIHLYGFERNAT